jgi:ParB/RepB/Spo0J family partition protein
MQIKLDLIHPSPHPIRKTWDETKLNELKWSLMEEGQVEPIGVRENGKGYIIVWGHRRVEAARRAGWNEIEAVVVPADEVNNLIQAGIENLASEDMTADEKADWVYRLNVEFGMTLREISRRSTVDHSLLSGWMIYKQEKEAGVGFKSHSSGRPGQPDEGVEKIKQIYRALGDDLEAKKAVAAKVSDDELTTQQTVEVARAYRDAPTPEVKAAVLRQPIISRDTSADILRRSINRVEIEGGITSLHEANDFEKEREERRTYERFDFAVKEFLDSARLFLEVVKKGSALVKYGKYSPEAAKFAIRKIDNMIDELKTYKEELERVK